MSMWATAPLPYYSEYHTGRRTGLDIKTGTTSSKASSILGEDVTHRQSMAGMLEPAIEGPPSPERLRQLSKQAKRASHLRRLPGHRTASSGSSSLRSNNVEQQPAWELTMENLSLGRRPSARSTSSSNISRERPESVQFPGRGLFTKRNKANRESKSSSGSSLYSAETSANGSFVMGSSEVLSVPTLFARRKPGREELTKEQKKLQISGPFNFEHVSSSRRDEYTGGSALSTPGPTSAPVITHSNHESHYYSHSGLPSPENARIQEFGLATAPIQRPALLGRHTAPVPAPRRLIKHAQSSDQLRRRSPPVPTRTARTPSVSATTPFPPVPPPRKSSHGFDMPFGFDKVRGTGGFHRLQPSFSSSHSNAAGASVPASASDPRLSPEAERSEHDVESFSHAITTPETDAWPLLTPDATTTTFESPLPDVPEEEEHYTRRSRLSVTSNNSSLRGSQSVPMLRSFAQSQRTSGTSDTLGRAALGSRNAGQDGQAGVAGGPPGANDNWEDCIDYCYDHEADANFDYQWERTSTEADRNALFTALDDDGELDEMKGLPTTSVFVIGAEREIEASHSPRQGSASPYYGNAHALSPKRGNFSLPRNDRGDRVSQLKLRPISIASSFKESQGFNLSPSLLIPGDYHQQMLLSASDDFDFFQNETPILPYRNPDESQFESKTSLQQRSSTSTTESNSTAQSDTISGRHTSTNSNWTASTRLTSSTTSLTKLAVTAAEYPTHLSAPSKRLTEPEASFAETEADSVPDLVPFPSMAGKRPNHRSHASESITRDETPASKSADLHRARRPRARTTSLSSQQAPPVGQYALFPKTNIKGTGDRI